MYSGKSNKEELNNNIKCLESQLSNLFNYLSNYTIKLFFGFNHSSLYIWFPIVKVAQETLSV